MCIQKVSYRIGLFIDNDYKSATKLHNSNETYLRRWEKVELKARKIAWTKQKSCFIGYDGFSYYLSKEKKGANAIEIP